MRIKKLQHKRLNFPPQEMQPLREQLETTPINNIHEVLKPYQEWPFVRGDMYHWITVLNRFDDIMADVCEKFGLTSLQKVDFDAETRVLLVAILEFSRLLMENCINRNVYNSVERLDCLLNTSDPEVLESTLRMLLRAAHRWSYQRDVKTSLTVMSTRLMTVADTWRTNKDIATGSGSRQSAEGGVSHNNEFKMLASGDESAPPRTSEAVVRYSFFRTADEARQLEEDAGSDQSKPQSKRNSGLATEGLVAIDAPIDSLDLDRATSRYEQVRQAFDTLVAQYRIPAAHQFELRHRIQVAMSFATGDSALRFTLLRSRICAAAILSQLMSEQEFKNAFLSREPNFTADIISVLQPEVHAPLSVQTAVLLALEAVLKQRNEVSGAYAALNASANHGVLMFILRKAFAGTGSEQPLYPYEFMNALYVFLTTMASNLNGSQLLVSAGVVPIFVSVIKHTYTGQLRSTGRVAKLLDLLITTASSAFPAFCSADGIAVLVKRMHTEVTNAVTISDANPEAASDFSSPVNPARLPDITKQVYRRREILAAEHIYLLKELFKLLSHLLQQPTYHDRLRNLIETNLPQTMRTVVTHPAAFGGNIYGLVVSITSMLIHNEPTSLPIIQEVGLPEALLENLESRLPYNGDVVMNIPGVLGAFCLNEAGMEQFRKSSIVPKVLSAFSDPDFVRVLQEGDVPGSFGAALDEFMRHFPAVKEEVMDEVIRMLQNVVKMGASESPLTELGPGNTLLLRSAQESEIKSYLDDYYGMMLESATTFLEGLLEQRSHSQLFLSKGGWDIVVKAMRSPLLPFDFVKSRTFKSLHGLASTLIDTSQEKVYKALFSELRECLALPLAVTCQKPPTSGEGDSFDGVAAFLALSDPTSLSADEYASAHVKLHNTISVAGVVALIANMAGGLNGGSLTRSLKDLSDVIAADDFVDLVKSICALYCGSIKKAVAIEHALTLLPESSEDKKADGKISSASPASSQAQTQAMDVDSATPAPAAVEPYIRFNISSLSDVIVTLTVQTGDLIECLSNSLGLTTKATTEGAPPIKLGSPLAKALTDFVFELLRLCKPAEHMITAAQLVDQVMIIIMKTMVFARHRIYLKLRVFMMFIELHGLKEFCQQLQYMWDWAVTIPAVEAAALDKASDAAKPADPNAGLRQIMNNALESMLSILSFIVDGEPLMESPELPALCKGHEEQQCWFRMSDFMVEVRLQALPALQHIWESQLLFTGSNNLMMAFMSCLAPVLNAQHETRTNSSRMGFRAHFPGLVERRRVGQPAAAAAAGAAGRGSGAQTPIPMLGRALGAVERSSPLAQTPIQPLSAESLEMETQQSNNDAPEATSSATAAPAGPSNDQSQGNDRSSEGDFATRMSIDSVESPVVPPASVDNAEATAVAITEAEAGEPSVAPTGIEPYNLPSWREAKDAEETAERERLKKIRGALRDNITPRVIAVVDEFKSKAVVQVKSALELVLQMGDSLADINMLMNAFKPLLDFASNMTGDAASGDLDERLAAHAYLWAVVLSSSVLLENIYPHMGSLSSHILRALEAAARREGRSPPWLTALLLVAEQLLQRDMRPAKVKLESKEEFQRIAKRGLTKLPPSKEPIDPSVAPAESSVSREAEAIRSMFAQPLLQRLQPQGSAFEQILLGHDEEEEEDDDLSGDDARAQPGQQTASVAGPPEPASSSADASKPQAPPPEPVFSIEQRFELQRIATLFFAAPVPEFSGSVLNALMRLIVILTRDPQFAVEFLDSGALASVVRTMRTMSTGELPSIKATAKERTPLGFVNALMNVNKEQRQEQRQERSLIMHILRHVVESRPVLRLVMENLIQGWFESSQYSSTDVNSFARATLPYALRNVDLFTDVASERCFLPNYNEEMRVSWMVLAWRSAKLLDEEEVDKYEASSKSGEEFLEYLNGKKGQPSFEAYEMDAESERLACRVAEFLCDEILSLRTAQTINSSASTTMLQSLAAAAPVAGVAPTTKARVPPSIAPATSSAEDSPDAIAYRVFLMQCLSEMIASFPFTLRAIFVARSSTAQASVLTPRREKPKDKGKGVATTGPTQDEGQASPPQKIDMRVRSPLISYLVHDLVVREAVTNAQARRLKNKAAETEGTELDQIMAIAKHQIAFKQGQLSNSVTFWASALLSTVCVRHQQGWSTTRPKAGAPATDQIHTLDLECLVGNYDMSVFAARHMALDHIVRAFRECLSTTAAGMGIGGADVIYARLTSLAQLVHKLVIARPISHGRSQDSHGSETDSSERESSSALRQVILERGVLDLLSAASSRVNLNHPLGREMLGVFLRPIELLSKAAVKISREAVLKAWEESGQEKMPSVAMGQQHRGPGVADMWDDDNALEDSADAGVPPDLYENSALGLYQNQRTAAGHGGTGEFDDGELMEEDFDEEIYDEDNSSASDIDTEEEEMVEDMLLAGNDGADGDDMSDVGSGAVAGDLEMDEDDDSSESGSGSGSDSDSDLDSGSEGHMHLTVAEAENLLQAEEDRMMEEDEEAADFYGSDLEGEVVLSGDEHGDNADGDDDDAGWHSEISDMGMDALDALEHHIRQIGSRSRGGTGDASAGAASQDADVGGATDNAGDADDVIDDDDIDDDGNSNLGSSDDDIDFGSAFPDSLEITMEALDGHGRPTTVRAGDIPAFMFESLANGATGARGLRMNQMFDVRNNGRPIAVINGAGARGGTLDFSMPHMQSISRATGLAVGGVGIGSNLHNMAHPLLDHAEPSSGLQARVERVSRSAMSGPMRPASDDLYGLGSMLATRLSAALTGGRRPAQARALITGHDVGAAPAETSAVSDKPSATPVESDGSVEDALSDAGSQASAELEKLLRLSMAMSAIEAYMPMSNIERWQEEARLLMGSQASLCVPWIVHGLLNRLIPETLCQSLLKQRYQIEMTRRVAQSDRERMEREDAERHEVEEAARVAQEQRLREADSAMVLDAANDEETGGDDDDDDDDGEDSDGLGSEGESGSGSDSGSGSGSDSDSDVDSESGSDSAASGDDAEDAPEPAAAAEPVFVTINGQRLDITDTGIDPEFLSALPDDLRMEVIQGRREELRMERQAAAGSAAGAAQTGSSARDPQSAGSAGSQAISQEFLDALPPEIRAEILEEERLQRQMLAHQEMLRQRFGANTAPGVAGATSSASASAAPSLSPVATAIQERMRLGMSGGAPGPHFLHQGAAAAPNRGVVRAGASGSEDEKKQRLREKRRKKIASRDITTQLLSRAEMAALARFVFLPSHSMANSAVVKTMQYVCENGRTRSQLIQLMLSILDSNATTLADVDAIIRQAIDMGSGSSSTLADPPSLGASDTANSAAAQASMLLGAPAVAQFTVSLVQNQSPEFSFPLSELQSDIPAYLPAQRSLEMLHTLAAHNPRASMHFLIEHHLLKSLQSGKQVQRGGDENDEDNHFPVVHLLRLLEKPLYYSHGNAITELLMQLLSTITKPLTTMVRRNSQLQQQQEQQPASAASVLVSAPASAVVPSGPASTNSAAFQLPRIPAHALRAIVNVLAAGECTSRTFQHTLSLIQNLSSMTGVLTVVTDELVKRASELASSVCQEIAQLLDVLKELPAPKDQQPQQLGGESRNQNAQSNAEDGNAATLPELPSDILDQVRDITLSKFSPAPSHQSRLLRLLMAIEYISTTVAKRLEDKQQNKTHPAKPEAESEQQDGEAMDVDPNSPVLSEDAPSAELLHLRSLSLGHDAQFLPLWEATSRCLQYTSESADLAHVATVLLPLIESFMVVFKPVVGEKTIKAADNAPSALQTSASFQSLQLATPTGPAAQVSGETYFQNFTEKHKKILNTLVRNNPGLLSGSFSLLVFNPHVLDFDNKRSYFNQRLHDDSASAANAARRNSTRPLGSALQLNVHRESVFEDTYHQFVGKSGEEIKRGRINVRFYEEEGVDAGGVSREWFQALARQMLNPNYALFKPSAAGRVTYQPNPQSWVNPEHLHYFKFVGRIIGKAIVDQRVLDAYFTRSFYKHILGRKVDYRDMEAIDPSYYKSLEWILENDITDVFDETFSIEVDNFGQHRVIELIPDGQDIAVTEDNKAEYVRLVTEQRLYRAIKDQIEAFLTGFHELIPKELVQIFNEQEVELLISGMPDIDVDDWRNNTEYHGGYSTSSAPVQWFWRAVRSFDQEERAKLLQFVTGTSKVPLEGFAHLQGNQGVQKFQIHKDFGSPTRLPTAHTCFNQLDLPLYDNFETLKYNLLLAISECSTGFGFV